MYDLYSCRAFLKRSIFCCIILMRCSFLAFTFFCMLTAPSLAGKSPSVDLPLIGV